MKPNDYKFNVGDEVVTVINNRVYIDGYEFVNGKWKKTLRALWHKWF